MTLRALCQAENEPFLLCGVGMRYHQGSRSWRISRMIPSSPMHPTSPTRAGSASLFPFQSSSPPSSRPWLPPTSGKSNSTAITTRLELMTRFLYHIGRDILGIALRHYIANGIPACAILAIVDCISLCIKRYDSRIPLKIRIAQFLIWLFLVAVILLYMAAPDSTNDSSSSLKPTLKPQRTQSTQSDEILVRHQKIVSVYSASSVVRCQQSGRFANESLPIVHTPKSFHPLIDHSSIRI